MNVTETIKRMTDNAIEQGNITREEAGEVRQWVLRMELEEAAYSADTLEMPAPLGSIGGGE